MENNDNIRRLNRDYYGMLVAAVAMATIMYWLVTRNVLMAVSPLSPLGQAIQYIIILDALVTIPFGLWWHKRTCKQLMLQEDTPARTRAYCKSARLRIYLVSNAMVLGIGAFYLMGAYQSMLWIAGISAIGWYFAKPTEKKMMMELQPETY